MLTALVPARALRYDIYRFVLVVLLLVHILACLFYILPKIGAGHVRLQGPASYPQWPPCSVRV